MSNLNPVLLKRLAIILTMVNVLLGAVIAIEYRDGQSTASMTPAQRQAHLDAQAMRAQEQQILSNPRVKSLEREGKTTKTQSVDSTAGTGATSTSGPVVTLKVMNVFTKNADGSRRFASNTSVDDFSRRLVETQNTVFENSGVHLRVELVDTEIDDTYVPRHGDITGVTDDWMNNPKSFSTAKLARTKNNADIVMIMTGGTTGGCGVAHAINDHFHAKDAVAAVDLFCQKSPVTNMVYAHELGHTLGLEHDRVAAGTAGKTLKTTNFGYVDPKNNIRDIMSYDTACTKNPANPCTQVSMYSSPRIQVPMELLKDQHIVGTYQVPLGDALDDAVGYMNAHLTYYAAMNFDAGN